MATHTDHPTPTRYTPDHDTRSWIHRFDKQVERVIAVAAVAALVLGLLNFLGVRVSGPGSDPQRLERLERDTRAIKQVVCIMARRTDPTIVPPECNEPTRIAGAVLSLTPLVVVP